MTALKGIEGGEWTKSLFVYADNNSFMQTKIKQDGLLESAKILFD